MAVDRGAFIYNGRDGYDLLLDWLSRPSICQWPRPACIATASATALADAAVWLAVGIAVAAGRGLADARACRRRAATRMAATVAVPAAIMLAATIVWAGLTRPALTPATSQMGFLRRWSPQRPAAGAATRPDARG